MLWIHHHHKVGGLIDIQNAQDSSLILMEGTDHQSLRYLLPPEIDDKTDAFLTPLCNFFDACEA